MDRVHGESCSVRYPEQGPRGVMHSEVSWAARSTGSTVRYPGQGPWESCSVRYLGPGPRGVMLSEVSWAGSTGSHVQ